VEVVGGTATMTVPARSAHRPRSCVGPTFSPA
jgi:hypothetical protein